MITMKPEEFLESGLLEQYVLGLLDEDQNNDVASYIASHDSVRIMYEEMQNTISNLAASHQIKPPAHIKQNILKEINNDITSESIMQNKDHLNWLKYLLLGLVAVLTIATIFSLLKIKSLEKDLSEKQNQFATLQSDCDKYTTSQIAKEKLFAFYQNPETKSAFINGNHLLPEAAIVTRYNKATNELVFDITSELELPNDKVLCMWGDINGEMVFISTLEIDNTTKIIPFNSEMESLNITIETKSEKHDHPDVSMLIGSVRV